MAKYSKVGYIIRVLPHINMLLKISFMNEVDIYSSKLDLVSLHVVGYVNS